jgi:homoserine dehydrogenase
MSNKKIGKKINVGVIGHGNIGRGVVEYLQKGNGAKFGVSLKKVAVSNIAKHKKTIPASLLTDKVSDILNDPEIDIVVELIGGLDPAKKYILSALKNGKSVITANKAVMAKYTKELFDIARNNNVDLAFEAAVGGGIPIISTLNRYKGEKIERVLGILNGTTNFILSKMEEGLDFEKAVKIAQDKGFAEANHILDTGGFDARDKLALLASLIFDSEVNANSIATNGITEITSVDIDFADKYGVEEGGPGYVIKLLAVAERINGSVELRVNPALVLKTHPLAAIRDEVNAVFIDGELAGPQIFSGRGAGTDPTSSAVISDIIRIASNIQKGVVDDLPGLTSNVKFLPSEKSKKEGYIRINLFHKPGSLYEVAGIIAKHNLNIKDSIQRAKHGYEAKNKTVVIPDIITIESAPQKVIDQALRSLSKSNKVDGDPFFMDIED